MLVAIGFVPWFRPLAVCLFSFGVVVQLTYAAWQTAGLWRGSHPEEATTPGPVSYTHLAVNIAVVCFKF